MEGNVSLDASAPLGHLGIVIGQAEVDPGSLADRTKDTVLSADSLSPSWTMRTSRSSDQHSMGWT